MLPHHNTLKIKVILIILIVWVILIKKIVVVVKNINNVVANNLQTFVIQDVTKVLLSVT